MEEINLLNKYPGKWFDARTLAQLTKKSRSTIVVKMRKLCENIVTRNMYEVKQRSVKLGRTSKFEWSRG